MTTAPPRPFVLVGDPSAAACEGEFCAVPEVRGPGEVPEDQEPARSPDEEATRPEGR